MNTQEYIAEKLKTTHWLLCVALFFALFFPLNALAIEYTEPQPQLPVKMMNIHTSNGQKFPFAIEVTDSAEERERGLMFRKEVAANQGMLFVFGENYRPYLWMKNTLVSLDMLFLDKEGYILYVKHRATPKSLEPIGTGAEVWAVIELQGGICNKLGIRVGDRVLEPRKPVNMQKNWR